MTRARDLDTCQCCGLRGDVEIHHIHPIVFGGSGTVNNAIALCSVCHEGAPNNPDEFLEYQKIGGLRIVKVVASCLEVITSELQQALINLRLSILGMIL